MANKVTVVGVGPGGVEYLTMAASKAIDDAQVVVGAARLLSNFAKDKHQTYAITSDLKQCVRYIIEARNDSKIAVLVSGDSGLYSFTNYLLRYIDKEQVEIIPGISAVQLMFAKIKRPWDDVTIISMHGRIDSSLVEHLLNGKTVAVLTDNKNTPQLIARMLLNSGCPDAKVTVGSNLSCKNEHIYDGCLSDLINYQRDLLNSVMVIEDE